MHPITSMIFNLHQEQQFHGLLIGSFMTFRASNEM